MTSRCQDLQRTLIDMDTPEDAGRYLGCEHVFKQNVKLDVSAHPFAHVFDASIPGPSSKPASPARRTKDYKGLLGAHARTWSVCSSPPAAS